MKKLKVSQLIQDDELLEIRKVQPFTVSDYRQAARQGAKFPPIIIEKGTNIVVSGNHRTEMYMQEFGPDHEVEVIEKTYESRKDLLIEFANENLTHGRPFAGFEKRNLICSLAKHMTTDDIAKVINMPVRKVKDLAGISVCVLGSGGKKTYKPVKHGLEHLSGSTMKEADYNVMAKQDRGISCSAMANQLRRWIENGYINMEDEKSIEALELLHVAVTDFLKKV